MCSATRSSISRLLRPRLVAQSSRRLLQISALSSHSIFKTYINQKFHASLLNGRIGLARRYLHILTTTPDPSRSDLFYHLTQLPDTGEPAYLLSFLSSLPENLAHPESAAVLGVLPASPGENAQGTEDAGLNDFRENPKFRTKLHEAIAQTLDSGVDEIWENAALVAGTGWIHIHDERNPPMPGRIGEPEDIIGSVRVEEGKIIPGTYQPMPAYRIVSANGVTTLTPGTAKVFNELVSRLS